MKTVGWVEGSFSPSSPSREFNPFRCTRRLNARTWVQEVQRRIEEREGRQKKRRPYDRETFRRLVEALLSDIALSVLQFVSVGQDAPSPPFLQVQTASRTVNRYAPRWTFSDTFRETIGHLAELGLVEFRRGAWTCEAGKHCGVIRATEALSDDIRAAGLTVTDFGTNLREFEPVRLRQANTRTDAGWKRRGALIDYEDTHLLNRWRSDMKHVNEYLDSLDLQCSATSFTYRLDDGRDILKSVDTGDRAVYRVWNNGTFDQGGRLYGGFWLSMPKALRREAMRIDGRPVAHADYGQLFVRLAYALLGKEAPVGDLYAVPGWEEAREAVKTFFNACFYPRGRPNAFPQGARAGLPDHLKGQTGADLRRAVEAAHPAIAPLFGTSVGFRLLGFEGDIAINALRTAEDEGLSVLPIHDCFLCPDNQADAVCQIMRRSFEKVTGQRAGPIGVS